MRKLMDHLDVRDLIKKDLVNIKYMSYQIRKIYVLNIFIWTKLIS